MLTPVVVFLSLRALLSASGFFSRARAIAVVASLSLWTSSGCSSADPIEVTLAGARAAVVVQGSLVHALELTEDGRLSVPRGPEGGEIFVVPYGCSLGRLKLPSGVIEVAVDSERPGLPPTRRGILAGKVPAEGGVDFREIAGVPAALSELRLLIEEASEGCCPEYLLEGAVNVTFRACGEFFCAAHVSRDADLCELTIDTSPCDQVLGAAFGSLTVRVEDSAVEVEFPPQPTDCMEILPRPHTSASFDCGLPRQCPLDVRLPPKTPLFEVTTATVIPGVEKFGAEIARPSYADSRRGYLSDLVLSGDQLIVASSGERALSVLCPDDAPATTFHYFDADSLQEIATSTAPPCSLVLARDPAGAFLSAHATRAGYGYDFFVVRRNTRGRAVEQSAAIHLPVGGPEYVMRPNALYTDADRIYLATGWDYLGSGTAAPQEELVVTLAADLRELERAAAEQVVSFTRTANEVAWVEDGGDVVRYSSDPADRPARVNDDPGEINYHLPTGSLLVPTLDEHGGIFVVTPADRGAANPAWAVPPFDSNAGFTSISAWPKDQVLVLAGGLADRDPRGAGHRAAIALFSPEWSSFVPGMQAIGWGPVRKLTPHASGRVYGILPWAAQLVQIRAR